MDAKGLIALLVPTKDTDKEKVDKKINNSEYKTGLNEAAQDLLDAIKTENADAIAMALLDAYECIQDRDYEKSPSINEVKDQDQDEMYRGPSE